VIARPGCFRMQPHQTSNPKAPCDENKCSEEVRGLGTLEQVERLRARLVWLQPGAGKRGGAGGWKGPWLQTGATGKAWVGGSTWSEWRGISQ
jgi:hypothetical protein